MYFLLWCISRTGWHILFSFRFMRLFIDCIRHTVIREMLLIRRKRVRRLLRAHFHCECVFNSNGQLAICQMFSLEMCNYILTDWFNDNTIIEQLIVTNIDNHNCHRLQMWLLLWALHRWNGCFHDKAITLESITINYMRQINCINRYISVIIIIS